MHAHIYVHLSVCVHAHTHTGHRTHVEVIGQLDNVCSLFLPCGPWELDSGLAAP